MKISANDIKVGNILEIDNKLWKVLKTEHTKPGKGGAFVQVEMKDINDVRIHSRIRDESAALNATKLATKLSLKYNRRLHILHLTTAEECDLLRNLPRENQISTEVCPQHLVLSSPECYENLGTKAQMNPPIRSQRHSIALWHALKDGIINLWFQYYSLCQKLFIYQ